MSWDNDPVIEAPATEDWGNDPVVQATSAPRAASGPLEALQAGYQGSATGLAIRGRLPDVVLDPQHAKWYEKALASVGQMASETPEMIAGAVAGGAAGSAVAPGPGTLVGAGAGAFAVPAAIRTSLMEAYKAGTVDSSGGFLNSARIVLKETGKEALIGGLTFGAGGLAARTVGKVVAPMIGETIGVGGARAAIGAAQTGAELGTMVVSPAALDGRLPEPQDFLDAALVVGFAKGAVHMAGPAVNAIAGRMQDIYAKTGIRPEQVAADAQRNPEIALDLKPVEAPTAAEPMVTVYHGSPHEFEAFDMSKVGTGEGAQAFGHGLYFAENPNVAADYAAKLGSGRGQIVSDPMSYVRTWLNINKGDRAKTLASLEGLAERDNNEIAAQAAELVRQGVDPKENNYKVQIPQRVVDSMLDWDKPLSEQSDAVKAALANAPFETKGIGDVTGRQILEMAQRYAGPGGPLGPDDPRAGSALLKSLGIEGVRYLDQQSRNVGKGTSNYVLFDAQHARVVERNGKTVNGPVDPYAEYGPEIPLAYQQAAAADTVANAMPVTPKIADFIGNMEGVIPDRKTPGHVNYANVESPDDLKAIMAAGSRAFADEIAEKRGAPKGWEDTLAGARAKIAAAAGVKVDEMPLDEQVLMKYAMLRDATIDAKTAAQAIADKRKAGIDITEEDSRRQIAAAAMVEATLANALGKSAEVGRALNVHKAAKQITALAADVKEMRDKYGDDPALFSKMLLAMDTPEKMGKFLAKATVWEKVVEAWKAGILSGPVTHIANVLGNTTFMAMRPVVDMTAAAIGRLTGMQERVSAAEPFSRVLGNLQGAKDALVLAGETLKLAYEQGGIKGLAKEIAVGTEAEGPHKAEQFRKAIGGTTGDIVRLPFRLLSVADEFFKTMNERGEAYALATRQAVSEGFNIQTREFRERVADLVQNDTAIAIEAKAAGLRFTFNTPLGEKGQAVQALVRKANLQMLVPFIRTPGNIFKEMIRTTPLAPLVGEWKADYEAGGAARAKAIAEVAMGTTIGAVVASYVLDGNISGQGSPDPGKRRVAAAAGWQPYSVKIGDKWYSYQRLQPLGTLVGMAADLAEVSEHLTEEESGKAVKMLSVAFANAVTQQTFLQGITSIVQAIADPQRYGPRFVQQYAGSVVPAIIAQPVAMFDPVQREVNGILDAVKSRIPGARGTLLEKKDVFGESMPTKERLGGASPIQESAVSTDKVRTEAERIGFSLAAAPKKVHVGIGTGKAGDIKITDEQRNMYSEISGQFAHQILAPIVSGPSWNRLPDEVQRRIYQRVFTSAHKMAAAQVFTGEERAAVISQISSKVEQEMRPR